MALTLFPATKLIKEAAPVNNGRGTITVFIAGLGIGIGLGLLFAPMSGEHARQWLAESAEDRLKRIRRKGRRWVYQVQDVLDKGEDRVTKVLRTGKNALDSVASRLD
jgi:gas vesicle protein